MSVEAAVASEPAPEVTGADLEELEIELLLEAIYRRYAFDFRDYAPASLRRRLWRRAQAEGLFTLTALHERVLHEPACMERLLLDLSVTTTSLFRDPPVWRALREQVVPVLRTHPFLRIWTAGCSTGEETYSMAVLLEEEGLLSRSRIYATDVSESVLARARAGTFALARMDEAAENHRRSGAKRPLSASYTAGYDAVRMRRGLTENVVWGRHNLVSDSSFNEFHLVLCRNVLIYFGRPLQDRVHELIHASLGPFGFLGLGSRESLRFTAREADYEAVDASQHLYRKVP